MWADAGRAKEASRVVVGGGLVALRPQRRRRRRPCEGAASAAAGRATSRRAALRRCREVDPRGGSVMPISPPMLVSLCNTFSDDFTMTICCASLFVMSLLKLVIIAFKWLLSLLWVIIWIPNCIRSFLLAICCVENGVLPLLLFIIYLQKWISLFKFAVGVQKCRYKLQCRRNSDDLEVLCKLSSHLSGI
uniref:Uncharacterized protein n=1 Tax=Oryza nivara TaxID=4536 RepID=A0A0E0I507_ORYNI